MKTTDNKITYLIIAITLAIVVTGSILYLPHTNQSTNLTTSQQKMAISVSSSYVVTEVEDVNALADVAIQGTIVKKYSALESRDEFGVLIDSNSKDVALSIPFLVYEIQPSHTFKGEKAESILVKVNGGSIGNLTVQSDHDELDVGEIVVFLLNGPYENGLYQLVAGPYASFKIQDGKAIGKYQEMPLEKLQNRLN